MWRKNETLVRYVREGLHVAIEAAIKASQAKPTTEGRTKDVPSAPASPQAAVTDSLHAEGGTSVAPNSSDSGVPLLTDEQILEKYRGYGFKSARIEAAKWARDHYEKHREDGTI